MINVHHNSLPAINRLEGFRNALSKHNIAVDDRYVVSSDFFDQPDISYNHGFNKKAGYETMKYLLNFNGCPDFRADPPVGNDRNDKNRDFSFRHYLKYVF